MNGKSPATQKDQSKKQTSLLEIVDTEKLLWATIQHKGISHAEVQHLYHKTRSSYEKVILNGYQTVDLQEIEYSLWKLHYKHIDEYRKKIKKVSTNADSKNNLNSHVEGFKMFLSEVAEFYKDLIAKFRKTCGLSEGTLFVKKGGGVEPEILKKWHYVCHRFLVCIGDVSRYVELCKKPDLQKWDVAATYYLEATSVWPHSGNPQNQLALLATYIGDDFLALYHCIRSLAVKEPFPDARDNIVLLFEKNKASRLQSLSTDAHIDFSKPLERLSSQLKSHQSMDSTNVNKLRANELVPPAKTDMWPLFVRMTSFFMVKPSFEDLPYTFASMMKELEALLALNDVDLNSALEPYEALDSSRKGPYRAIQAVTILIFVLHNLKDPKGERDEQGITWAWTCTFSFLGHLIQRCLTSENFSSMLPAVLVFVKWYIGMLEYAETYSKDEKVSNAQTYFFGALVDLLSGFDIKEHEMVNSVNHNTPLWEDHELRGFEPVSRINDSLDFYTHSEYRNKYECGNYIRMTRIFQASIIIADRLKGSSHNHIIYDHSTRKFVKKNEKVIVEELQEEEEVILFNPLTRYNSEPIQTSNDEPCDTTEEGLRRSSSLYGAQNGSYRPHGQPSLSGWVLNKESLNLEREREVRNSNKLELAPISEYPTSSLANMSIADTPYVAPTPSAPPLLPEDPVWLRGNSAKEEHGILGALPVSRLPNLSTPQEALGGYGYGVPELIDAYRPPVFGLTSSEWLYRYNNNLSLDPPNLGNNFPGRYDGIPRIDKWGNRMVHFENPNQRQNLQHIKEREWQLQNESPFKGHPYMGN